jgi:SAM-dependent methyltransferase
MRYVLARHPGVRAVGVDTYSTAEDDERIEFHHGDLREVGLGDGRFDLISAWAVLEHVHEPLAYFKEVARLLKPGGRFLFVVTNSESLWSRRGYREDVPRHTYHFSHETLREYARLTGLDVTRQQCVSGIFDGRGKGTFKWGLSYANGPDWRARRARRFPLHRLLLKTVGNLVDQVVFALPWEVWLDRSGILFTEMRRP